MKQLNTVHPENFECFMDVYKQKLEHNVRTNPQDYAWSLEQLPTVLERMRKAVERGSFNKDSKSFRDTCKELKIKHTYKAIREFIS